MADATCPNCADLQNKVDQLRWHVLQMAQTLEDWANDSKLGGWSTHQVEPMRRKADDLRLIAAGVIRK